jgi:hypothetical protein
MANRPRKLTPKPQGKIKIKRISKKSARKSQRGNWLASSLAIALLGTSAAVVGLFGWGSFLFIFNPEKFAWFNRLLPEWARISLSNYERPQTILEIESDIGKKGQVVDKSLPLTKDDTAFLLPIFQKRPNCQSDCNELIELRVYQRSDELEFQSLAEKYYYLATQLPITGPDEAFVIAPFADATNENPGSSIELPLTEVKRFEGETPSPGIWFFLRGQRIIGTNAIAYGHIVHYHPQRHNLRLMLSWTSPNGQLPQWQQVTNGGTKELVVNQTVALEPQLYVYQVKPSKTTANPIQLELLSLTPPALRNQAYQEALMIARSGLWTPAYSWLQFIKKQQKGKIPNSAQAQIDLIRLHSQLTKSQAEKTWASPNQEVLANLIDGRWTKALQVFEASPQNAQEIATLLRGDNGRLWSRVDAALRVNPNRLEVQAWGALILAAQDGHSKANSWLKTKTKSQDSLTYIAGLLRQLNGEMVTKPTIQHPSRIIGSAQLITQVNPSDWLSKPDIQKTSNKWYQIQVSTFHDGKRWLNSPFANLKLPKTSPEKYLWEILGINSDPTIQIIPQTNNEQQTITATSKAVQLRNGKLSILAAITNTEIQPTTSRQLLALTTNALEWVQPFPITLNQLHQQDQKRAKSILPTLWRSLQASGQIPKGDVPKPQIILQRLGHWPVQTIDLTGNRQPEVILTISTEAIASVKSSIKITQKNKNKQSPRTIILSDGGKLIYNEFSKNTKQTLTAIAKLSEQNFPTLLVEKDNKYTIRRWSDKNQRFE